MVSHKKCVLDTNVPKTANLASEPESVPVDLLDCVLACVETVEHVVSHGGLVLDAGDEIFDEYRQNLAMSGMPGIGDGFMKWVHDHRWTIPEGDRVTITPEGDSYLEFPDHPDLAGFDPSDRKFVATANAHHAKPPICQATDSKWWGWKDALAEEGIEVDFMCAEYIAQKYRMKMEK